MRILITSATGFIGSHLIQAVMDAGHEVVVCSRRTDRIHQRYPQIDVITADFSTDHAVKDWMPRLRNVDVVINAVGIIREFRSQRFDALHKDAPIALFQACEQIGVKRVIQISALGADESAFSHYHKSKFAADCSLQNLMLDWAIVQPSIVYGPGAKSMALFKAIAALPLIPIIDSGNQLIQPIHIADLVRAIVQLIDAPAPLRKRFEMVGPSPITMGELYEKLRHWLGFGRTQYLSIPYRLALCGAAWGGLMGNTPITEDAVQMLRNGNTGDVAPFIRQFQFKPISIEHALASTPAQQEDRWHAGLYFLFPLLRVAIAYVWIFTGIVSAFVFPVGKSYAMLANIGIDGVWGPVMLYSAAAVDLLFGTAVLFSYRPGLLAVLQIGLILLYSIIITIWLPEAWSHPFGPISKNLPLIVSIMMLAVVARR